MLAMTHYGSAQLGALPGLNFLPLLPGVDFECNKAVCFGKTTDVITRFKRYQEALNAFSSTAGFKPLALDGFLGANTVTANKLTGQLLQKKMPLANGDPMKVVIDQMAAGLSKEQIAGAMKTIEPVLAAAVRVSGLVAASGFTPPAVPKPPSPEITPPPLPSPDGQFVPQVPGAAIPGAGTTVQSLGPAKKDTKTWWIVGGAVVGTGILGGLIYWLATR